MLLRDIERSPGNRQAEREKVLCCTANVLLCCTVLRCAVLNLQAEREKAMCCAVVCMLC